MQEREEVRGSEFWWIKIIFSLTFIPMVMPGNCLSAVSGYPPWIWGRGKAHYPAERVNPFFHDRREDSFNLIASAANPYSIKGLRRYYFKLGYQSSRQSIWFEWSVISHYLYRENEADFLYHRPVVEPFLQFYLGPVVWIRQVKGFAPIYDMSGFFGMAINIVGGRHPGGECWENGSGEEGDGRGTDSGDSAIKYNDIHLSAGLECMVEKCERWDLQYLVLSTSVCFGRFRLVCNRYGGGSQMGEGSAGIEIGVGQGLSLLSGYLFTTHQITAAVCFKSGSMMVALAWIDHPSLGMTLSAGVGRWWM